MASLPTPPTVQPYMLCQHVGEKAVLLFTRAIKAETGLDLRSTGRSLLTGTGDISVQVPRVVDGHRWPNPRTAGMILRVSPRQTGWAPWPGVGAVFREYQMGQAQTLSAAQRTARRGGPIIGARCVSFRLAVRPRRTVPDSIPLSCPWHPAQVAVLASTHPSTGPLRYWSERDPQGGVLQRPEGADPEANSTNTTTPQSQPDARGPRDTGTTADPRGPGGAEGSGTTLIAVLSTPAPGLTGDAVSNTPKVPQVPVGRIGGRPLIISSSSLSSGGRRLAFQKPFLISGQGMCFDCSVFLAIVFAEWEVRKI
jgi:hypothetical protein